jgi:oleandomycin transport system permease protein
MTSITLPRGGEAAALERHPQPALAPLRQTLAMSWRAVVKLRRTPEQFLDVTLQPIIFLLMFVYLFGGAVSGSQDRYLEFVLPGLMLQNVLFTTVAIGVNLHTDVEKGVFDRFRSLPISRSAPLVGAVLAEVVRYTLSVTVLLVTGTVMGFRIHTGVLDAVAAVLLTIGFGLAACWISVFVGMIARSSGSVQGISFMVMFPLTFAASTFVPADTLPGWLQAWVRVNPVNHGIEALRGLLLGGPVAGPVAWTVGWALALLAVFAPLAVRTYRRRA